MGYDRGDSFSFDFEANGFPFGLEKIKKNCHHDHIPFNLKGNKMRVFSVDPWIQGSVHLPIVGYVMFVKGVDQTT